MHGVGDVGGGGGVDGGAVDEETVRGWGRGGKGGEVGEAGVKDLAEDGFDVGGLGEYGDDDFL